MVEACSTPAPTERSTPQEDVLTRSEAPSSSAIGVLLLVRNNVEHDARVLRAAQLAEHALGQAALILGVASDGSTHAGGAQSIEGISVVRVRTHSARFARRIRSSFGARALRSGAAARSRTKPSVMSAMDADTLAGAILESAPGTPVAGGSASLAYGARLGRLLSGVSFAYQAVKLGRALKPRVVHANDWNTMWAGIAIKLLTGAALVYDSHELWADRNGRWESRAWLIACEALFVRIADQVITASPGYGAALASRYRVATPTVIRNIPSMPTAGPPAPAAPPALPVLVYVGGLLPGRGLEQAIDALALLPGVQLRTIGPGSPSYRAGLLARAAAHGVTKQLELRDAVAPAAVTAALEGATAGLCLIQPVCRSYELTLPNKLFEYASAGLPILASDLPVIAAVVGEHELGEVVSADDPQAVAGGLLRLCQPSRWQVAAARSREYALANNWAEEACKLAEVYRRVG